MPLSFSDESKVDTDIPKPIYCSKALVATEVLILFFQQQPQWILNITHLQREIERQQSKKFHQTPLLKFLNKK